MLTTHQAEEGKHSACYNRHYGRVDYKSMSRLRDSTTLLDVALLRSDCRFADTIAVRHGWSIGAKTDSDEKPPTRSEMP